MSLAYKVGRTTDFPFPQYFGCGVPVARGAATPAGFAVESFVMSAVPVSGCPPEFRISPLVAAS